MAPEIEISSLEAQSVMSWVGERIAEGKAEILDDAFNAVGPVKTIRIDGQELRLHQVWHFDDEIDDHLSAPADLITELTDNNVISSREL